MPSKEAEAWPTFCNDPRPSADVSEVRREDVIDVGADPGNGAVMVDIPVKLPNESVDFLLLVVGGAGIP